MVYLNSSAIREATYNQQTRRMTIWFVKGHSYDFCGVPQAVYDGLITAVSAGRYYDQYIRDRYPC